MESESADLPPLPPSTPVVHIPETPRPQTKTITQHLFSVLTSKKFWLWTSATTFVAIALLLCLTAIWPQAIRYSFADTTNCVFSPRFLPGWSTPQSTQSFTISTPSSFSIGHLSLFSAHICAAPHRAPPANSSQKGAINFGFLHNHITVLTADYPAVATLPSFNAQAVVPSGTVDLTLGQPDKTFGYALVVSKNVTACRLTGKHLSCGYKPLQLDYSAAYTLEIAHTFHGVITGTIASRVIQTISAVAVTQASEPDGGIMYDQTQQFTLQTNKPLIHIGATTLTAKLPDGTSSTIPVTTSISGNTIQINAAQPLPRKASIAIQIASALGSDGSGFVSPYNLTFTTSAGPKVIGASATSNDVPLNATFAVTFDQTLLSSQDSTSPVTLTVNGTNQAVRTTVSGQRLQIIPIADFPVCAHVTLQLSNALQNTFGVSGDSAWSFALRARCYTTFSIGTSVQGRSMTAYKFGTGPSQILYVGATHGNESNTAQLLQKWISDLIANPDKIPASRTIVVIPQVNPDGVAANTRTNANGIDLNRNFPTNDWQTVVTEPDGATTNDGGPSPLSEPESQALASYVESTQPRFTFTYHSQASLVEANDAGDSDSICPQYASLARYQASYASSLGNTFDYSTTGAFEDWMGQKPGLPACLVELQTLTQDDFSRNEAALWFAAQL